MCDWLIKLAGTEAYVSDIQTLVILYIVLVVASTYQNVGVLRL